MTKISFLMEIAEINCPVVSTHLWVQFIKCTTLFRSNSVKVGSRILCSTMAAGTFQSLHSPANSKQSGFRLWRSMVNAYYHHYLTLFWKCQSMQLDFPPFGDQAILAHSLWGHWFPWITSPINPISTLSLIYKQHSSPINCRHVFHFQYFSFLALASPKELLCINTPPFLV